MANYRPISNLSFSSKLIEHAVLDQLLAVLQRNTAIPTFQSAYRKFHSTETAMCKIYNDLVMNSCQSRTTLLVLLDLSAAFDTVDHRLLLDDFSACGVRGSALALLESYLTDQTQAVVVGELRSEPTPMKFGVFQGSVLDPSLFLVYTGSLAALLDAHGVEYHFYADDKQVYIAVENIDDAKGKLPLLLADIKVWMKRRRLKLNSKTELNLVRGSLRNDILEDFGFVDFDVVQLRPVESIRDLGVCFDSKLTFKKHMNLLVRNYNYHVRNIYAVKHYLDKQSVLTLVHTLIVSRVD